MKTRQESKISLEQLSFLPSFAQYLLQHRLDEFVTVQIQFLDDVEIPMMKFFRELSYEQLFELSRESTVQLLTFLSENRIREHIELSIRQWKENQLPIIKREEINAEDITLAIYLRKKSFLHFISDYTTETEKVLELIREIDWYLAVSETELTNTYINILREKIQEDNLLIEKVNQTVPGAVYVFDVQNFKGLYANNKLDQIIGYDHGELNKIGPDSISQLVHPEDQEKMKSHMRLVCQAKDGEVVVFKYRVRDRWGYYRWLSNHESVFKRDDEGNVIQTIGITLDVDAEQQVAIALLENQQLYENAEALTHLGSYTWNLQTNELKWSPELYRIYGLEPGIDSIDFDVVQSFNHPDDTIPVRNEIQKAVIGHEGFDFYYRIQAKNGIQKILHARGSTIAGDDGNISLIIGTVQDVTEKQTLIRKLKQSESVYKQAEELANMGNWSWEIANDQLEWTSNLYRIYGIDPDSGDMTIDRFLSFVHPDDRERIRAGTENMLSQNILDYTFRIISANGKIKVLRSVAQVQRNEQGEPVMVIGTERDITEKQNLIDRLQRSEALYKQAQALAHVGNWSWHIPTNQIEWSDELYRIYGLDPAHGNLSYDEYLSFIYPDDMAHVQMHVNRALENNASWEFTHRLVRKNGDIRVVFATGEVQADESGKPYMVIGTAQDVTDRQNLIDRLQESERLSRQAQALAHIGNWEMDVETRDFSWSDEMYSIYEVSRDEFIDFDKWSSFIYPSEKEEVVAYYDECLREKKLYDKIHRIRLGNGKIKTIHRKGEFIFDENGNARTIVGTTQDITDEYRVQQELKENQMFIRKITDATPSIITSYNINTGQYSFVSEGLEKLLGYDRDEVMKQGVAFFAGIIHPDDVEGMKKKNAAAIQEANADPHKNDFIVEFTYRMRHRNGKYRWIHTYGTIFDRNRQGKVEHVLNISLDATEQMEAAEKIREQEHFIQQIADASPTILYLYDVPSQSIQYINREIFFVLGYLPEEIVSAGKEITSMLYHPEDLRLLPARKQGDPNYKQADSMIQYECRMKNKEGDWRWLLVREIVFKADENGNILQILGTALDINRRKEMEKTILHNTLLLEQSNASLEEFAYVASHDLKEPLRKISTFGDRLLATQLDNLPTEGKTYLQKIVDASSRMQTMINDLLSISMISGNTSFETFSLQEILEETLQTLEYKIEQQNAIVKADPLPEARIIPSQIRQLFQNLLSNSLKFVKSGVQPVITITHEMVHAEEQTGFQLSPSSQYHKMVFADNGIGFEMEYAGKIFAIFQRLHGRSEYEGSGIGLAICKKIVEHHGGIIYAKSIMGEGATFTIILPA